MKKLLILIAPIFITISLVSQTLYERTFTWQTYDREYIIEIPDDLSTPCPVMFISHGLGKTKEYAAGYLPSDRPAWIYIMPQGLLYRFSIPTPMFPNRELWGYDFGTAWNCGAAGTANVVGIQIPLNYNINENIDDTGFLNALLDSVINNYNVDIDSIFFSGSSLGGFMANRMGIEFGNRINGVASVSGTIGNLIKNETPVAPINALNIHGTNDEVIDYETGNLNPTIPGLSIASLGIPAEDVPQYWREFNQCDLEPIHYEYPDIHNDGKTFERFYYGNGINDSKVAFIKVNNGEHRWHVAEVDNTDIDCFTEIVKFFRGQWYNPIANDIVEQKNINIFPNPATDKITITNLAGNNINTIEFYDITGRIVKKIHNSSHQNTATIDISNLKRGTYIVKIKKFKQIIIIE